MGPAQTDEFRVELPGPKVSAGPGEDERVRLSIPRTMFNAARRGGPARRLAGGLPLRPSQGQGRCKGDPPARSGDRRRLSPRRMDPARLGVLRSTSQLHQRPAAVRHPVDVAREAGPVQAQEPRAARLAFRARSRTLVAADVDRARCEERSLLRAWLMRKTVHLIPTDDAGWLLPLFAAPIVRWSRKRLADFGLDRRRQDGALDLLHEAVDADGPLTRPELAERLTEAGFDAAQEIKTHLWLLATLDGELCLGPDRGGQTCLVRTQDWIGELVARPREDSLAELARRYVRAYGPASDRDFSRWAGLPLGRLPGGPPTDRGRAEREPRRRRDAALAEGQPAAGFVGPRGPPARRLRQLQPRLRQPRFRGRPRGRQSGSCPAAASSARRSPSTGASPAPGRRSAAAAASRSRSSRSASPIRPCRTRSPPRSRTSAASRASARRSLARAPLRSRAEAEEGSITDPRRASD